MQIWITLQYIDGQPKVEQIGVHSSQKAAEDVVEDDSGQGWGVFLGRVDIYGPFRQDDLNLWWQGPQF